MNEETRTPDTTPEETTRTPPEDSLIILPVRSTVVYPGMVLPLSVGRERSIAAAQEAAKNERPLGIVQQKDPTVEEPGPDDLYAIGTEAAILRYVTAKEGSHHIVVQGLRRFRIQEFIDGHPYLLARVEYLEEPEVELDEELEARMEHLKREIEEALELMPHVPAELGAAVQSTNAPGLLADLVAHFLDIEPEQKQEVLETLDVKKRLEKVAELLAHRLAVLRLTKEIEKQTKEAVDQRQREYILREQLKAIQRELGEVEPKAAEVEELRKAIAEAKMPEEVEKEALDELARLERLPEGAAEYSVVRNYLDWLISLPWSVLSEEHIDIDKARKILDEDHYGLEKVKKRILEYLAVRKLNPEGRSPILCFVGPPGVGKTSLGRSIARAVGLEFVRVSLGGVHDEAEIRGHRRTYVGAMPGNIVQGIRKAGTRNPVMMLDEIDKLGASIQGDPAAALLEVLDPEQNSTFRDNYLGVPFDLSKVFFIATANVLDNIPGPLRDRMEVIELPGYTDEEKVEIAKRYLVRRQRELAGLTEDQCEITEAALVDIVRYYTREAGCRRLEQKIGAVFRHAALVIAEGQSEHVRVDAEDLPKILGPHQYESELALRTSLPGVATGLAWTPVGGDILFIEATKVPGSGKLILTGQLGDVMKESAQAALTLVKAHARGLDIPVETFEKHDIHVHIPAGAIPKDGPSAGITLYTALVSLLTERRVRSDVAMTGEISLRGLVLPVGGIKEKVIAAAHAGIKLVMLPQGNKKDFEDIPQSAREKLQFVWLEHVDEALKVALEG